MRSVNTGVGQDRVERLAGAIGALARKVQSEGVAADEFSGARAELQALRDELARRGGMAGLDQALAELDAALRQPPAVADIRSRPAARRVRARAARLDASTRRLLRKVGMAVTATTVSVVVTASPLSAAAGCAGATSVTCSVDVPDGIAYGAPVTNLTVTAPSDDITPAVDIIGVLLDGSGAQGGEGDDDSGIDANGDDGGPGGPGRTVVADVDTGAHAIVTHGADGIVVLSNGGNGGEGGAADGAGADGGDGGVGGDGGSATVIAAGTITTSGEKADGIFAQSAGGVGGNGGNARGVRADGGDGAFGGSGGAVSITSSAAITTSGEAGQGIFGQSIGGRGGEGGNGGGLVSGGGDGSGASDGDSVFIASTGDITTSGDYASGIFGQSVGGYGGSGGSSSGLVAFGGDGSTAGAGGAVTISNGGQIHTTGLRAFGMFAQSVGGGGGSGGSGAGLVGLGSGGAAGGSGGAVSASNSGLVDTLGDGSVGVFAQSIGGGGGDGGSGSGLAGIGGSGSGTSAGGTAHAQNTGTVTTHGDNAQGVFAQSIGGGGGNGGSGGGLVAIGGSGGGGGAGGAVTAGNSGSIETFGENSQALLAQSVGGGGGNGGNASAAGLFGSIAIGGSGGAGGAAGTVTVNGGVDQASADSSIITHGDRSAGVFAQAVGGGGGNGGYAFAGSVGPGASASVAVGGGGAIGGAGGQVDVFNNGAIVTYGADSLGINAQSVGGGGGNGGFAIAVAASDGIALTAAVGGAGEKGGAGGQVTVTSWTDIETFGERSHGANAQSVGGGGGNGGFSISVAAGGAFGGSLGLGGTAGDGGAGGVASLSNEGRVTTHNNFSHGLIAQSVGGGGGMGGFSVAGALSPAAGIGVALGGTGGKGGAGVLATLESTGAIETFGAGSYGLLAQSIGGGGGAGGFAGALGAGISGGGLGLGFGGAGSEGGSGGEVILTSSGGALTHGDNAIAILAQSIGGGGGAGGFSIAAGGGQYAGLSLSMGGGAGVGGVGSTVTLHNTGAVGSEGVLAHGVLAQSIGGGGGAGGFALSGSMSVGGGAMGVGLGGSGGEGGVGGTVSLTQIGDVETRGASAVGVFAQSVGGGGGAGGFAGALAINLDGPAASVSLGGTGGKGGKGGGVTLTGAGNVITSGGQATAVLAQSVGGGGGNGGFSLSASGGQQASLAVSIGGDGGEGGTSDAVYVDYIGDILTRGELSYGVLAQSVAGGGGNGGFSLAGSLSVDAPSVSASLGGSGGIGAVAGDATIDLDGSVETQGDGSHAVFAQSVGGGGGSGGFSGALSLSFAQSGGGAVALSMGGSGGTGGDAAKVKVITQAGEQAVTRGDGAHGIMAQSVGGGGGGGGFSFAANLGTAQETSVGLSASLGGSGGTGGVGSDVDVRNNFNIFTFGKRAFGILAQSIGGGGGTGGFSATGAVSAGQNGVQGSVAVGGAGGTGGSAGKVEVVNAAQIVTEGEQSDGVFAQSVGGGGGDGGLSFAGTFGGPNAKSLAVSVGGNGGTGGDGGLVDVDNSGLIEVSGMMSNAVFAQSVGGGGGRGGFAIGAGLSFGGEGTNLNLGVTVGGQGGAGGIGGDVEVTNSGQIIARGQGGAGVYAQSVGGGGGAGGGAFTGVVGVSNSNGANAKARTVNANVTVGGGGGDGNHGGKVTVGNSGQIDTFGDDGFGIFAQSVGGGGGIGGTANAMSLIVGGKCSTPPTTPGGDPTGCGDNDPADNNWNLSVVIGGDGGGSSNGGEVIVANSGAIHTRGVTADGIVAQSIGGGGGIGGTGVLGLAGYTDIPVALLIKPIDKVKFFQNLTVGVGGKGGASGDGGLVSVNNSGAVTTEGLGSNGIFAQSVGGGGGRGGPAAPGAAGKVGIGGEAGAAGNGGDVTVINSGRIETFGNASNGVFAQSIGGGGGVGGDVQRGVPSGITVHGVSVKNVGVGLAFGGNGGGGGDGGVVQVTNTGDIVTHGTGASGIFAQSIGGGGGILGDLGNDIPILELLNFAGSVGDAGSAKAVTVTQTGDILTLGTGSHGIFAQSVGGQGTGADVSVTVDGDIWVMGERGDGILLQSTGLGGSGDLSVNILGGVVQGGSGPSAGIRLYDGGANSIINHGAITTMAGLEGLAIDTTGGNDALDSYGLIVGSLNLGGGSDSFRNRSTGEMRSGDSIILGAGETFTNDGLLNPGNVDVIRITALTGDFVQSATGSYRVDLDLDRTGLSGEADRFNISGSAVVDGKVTARVINPADALPGDHFVTVLTAAGGQTHAGLTLDAPVSVIATFDLRYPDANTIQLGYNIDYSVEGLNDNQTAVGEHVNAIQTLGGTPAFRAVAAALFYVPDVDALGLVYNQLAPLQQLNGMIGSGNASLAFTDQMFSCAAPGGQSSVEPGRSCGWMRVNGRGFEADATFQRLAWEEEASGMAAGYELAAGSLRLGAGLSYEKSRQQTEQLSVSDGERVQAGLSLKAPLGRTELAVAVTAGQGQFDTLRLLTFPTPASAVSQQDTHFGAVSLRASHTFGQAFYLKPSLELTGAKVRTDAFKETGAGPLNIQASAQSADFWRVKPAVELGGQWEVANGSWLRPSLKLGVSQKVSGEDWALTSSFEGAPTGADPFTVTHHADETLGEVNLAIDMVTRDGLSGKVGYVGRFGDTTREEGAYIKLTLPF